MRSTLSFLAFAVATGCTVITGPGDFEDGEPTIDGGRPDLFTGCGSDADCPTGFCEDGECVECRDALDCTAEAPVCLAGSCTGCSGVDDCSAYPNQPMCGEDGSCEGCAFDVDCTDPTMARCDTATSRCVPCNGSPQCEGTGAPVCDDGVCVECSVEDASACGANSCNAATNRCTMTERGSVRRCGACLADSECALEDDRCVPMRFMGIDRETGYCLKRGSTGCVEPYSAPTTPRESLSGAAPEAYCGIREDLTTCEAVLDLLDGASCSDRSECGFEGLEDGRCETVNLLPGRCTYDCGDTSECTSGKSCGAIGMYCGAPET